MTDVANRYRKGAQIGVPIELLVVELAVKYGIQAVKNAFKVVGNVAKKRPFGEGIKFSLPTDRPWKGLAGNLAPTFSPISDAI